SYDRLVCLLRRPPTCPLFPYTTLFRSPFEADDSLRHRRRRDRSIPGFYSDLHFDKRRAGRGQSSLSSPDLRKRVSLRKDGEERRSEEHTSELQSHLNLVCRLLLEKKKT